MDNEILSPTAASTDGRPTVTISRWKASAVHLAISLGIGAAVLLSMLFIWFRQPYLQAAGGAGLFLILLGVDVVLGPLITLIIFDTKKKHLKLDLAVIGALQLAALMYGLSVIFQARPAYLVFVVDRFELVLASDLTPEDLAKASHTDFKHLPLSGPRLVSADMPTDAHQRQQLLQSALQGADLQFFPQYYVRYEDRKNRARTKAQPLAKLKQLNREETALIDNWVKGSGMEEVEIAWLPMRAKKEDMAVLLNANTGDVLSVVPVSPW